MDKVDLGRNIKERRKFKNLSQAKLAETIGISAQMIKDIEAGRRNPSVPTLNLICEALGITQHALYSNDSFVDQTIYKGQEPVDMLKKTMELVGSIPPDIFYLARRITPDNVSWDGVRGILMAAAEREEKAKAEKKKRA